MCTEEEQGLTYRICAYEKESVSVEHFCLNSFDYKPNHSVLSGKIVLPNKPQNSEFRTAKVCALTVNVLR